MLKVGVNGVGRIGRNFLRASLESGANFEIVGINDLTDNATLAHLLKYDSILGRLKLPVTFTETTITVGGKTIAVSAERDPANIPWGKLGVDVVVESTGIFTKAADAGKHIYSTATRTLTIDSNANLALPVGTTITFVAGSGATVTIAITTDTMYLAGPGTTGSRTLAAFGMATAVKIASTTWIISGNGLT